MPNWSTLPDIKAIPLNSRRLNKLGFFYDFRKKAYTRAYGATTIFIREADTGIYKYAIGDDRYIWLLQYVHELQNLWYVLFKDILPEDAKYNPPVQQKNIVFKEQKKEDLGWGDVIRLKKEKEEQERKRLMMPKKKTAPPQIPYDEKFLITITKFKAT